MSYQLRATAKKGEATCRMLHGFDESSLRLPYRRYGEVVQDAGYGTLASRMNSSHPANLLSIVIVNWNTRDDLNDCLEALEENFIRDEAIKTRTIVVDNNSGDDSVAMVRTYHPWVELITNSTNRGFAKANNQGINVGLEPFVFLLNSDAIVHSMAIETMIRYLRSHPEAGAAGPKLLNRDGSLQVSAHPMMTPFRELWRLLFFDRIWPKASYPKSFWDGDAPRRVEVLKGAALMLRRQALDDVGLLDEEYFMYSEEVDLFYRLDKAGWLTVYVPEARVTHYGGSSSQQVRDEMFLELHRSKVQFFRKTSQKYRVWLYKLILLLAYLPRVFLRPRTTRMWRLLIDLPRM